VHNVKHISRLFYLQVAVIVPKNYTEFSDAGLSQLHNESIADPTVATDHFSFYTVVDRDSRFLLEFNYWIQAFLFKLVPCVLLTALTVMLIVAMHQANVRRMKLKSQVITRTDYSRTGSDLLLAGPTFRKKCGAPII